LEELFEGRDFDREIIILYVRWYLRFKVNFHGVVKMMEERGLLTAFTRWSLPASWRTMWRPCDGRESQAGPSSPTRVSYQR
jgi:hypothetical protein